MHQQVTKFPSLQAFAIERDRIILKHLYSLIHDRCTIDPKLASMYQLNSLVLLYSVLLLTNLSRRMRRSLSSTATEGVNAKRADRLLSANSGLAS